MSSVSPLGCSQDAIWKHYLNEQHCFSERFYDTTSALIAEISAEGKTQIELLRQENPTYKKLDDSVLFAIFSARQAIQQAGWNTHDNFGINIGSSRGATQLFEHYHADFIDNKQAQTLTSPTTTLGNISSWVGHDLQTQGPTISHSITCSTALHALLNGIAWIQAGMSEKFLVGGSEAPLTPFTIAQMRALKIYAKSGTKVPKASKMYPCQALNLNKTQNSMILGEGASIACLEKGRTKNTLATIEGVGYATEVLKNSTSISANGTCFQKSMRMALGTMNPGDIDIIITHTPGTVKGDKAEYNAISEVFCNKLPKLTTNKWKVGHTLGTSGMLSIEMAILMLNHQQFLNVPFLEQIPPQGLSKILINAVGFGGNAVSIVLSK